MRITGRDKLNKFGKKHSKARKPIAAWVKVVEKAKWEKSADVKATFNSVDNPGSTKYIFNLAGNNFRIVAIVKIKNGVVMVDKIMTHTEYDKWNKGK
jgi:mRNA interferase HigB